MSCTKRSSSVNCSLSNSGSSQENLASVMATYPFSAARRYVALNIFKYIKLPASEATRLTERDGATTAPDDSADPQGGWGGGGIGGLEGERGEEK